MSGYVYLTNGENWNDTKNRKVMEKNGAFGMCFSHAVSESVAMWMLYSGAHGKQGAILNFTNKIISAICQANMVELGNFDKKRDDSKQRNALIKKI